jgi:GT2 family glycosyltransferase
VSAAVRRPPVSVVMPFAGSAADGRVALQALQRLATAPGDELILVDNRGTAPPGGPVRVLTANAEHSPAYARNTGADAAAGDWILFLDADTQPPPDLLDRYFAEPIDDRTGALAGAVAPAPGAAGLASSYGTAKSFLSHDVHLAHPFMPRAAAANLLVRRAAFDEVGGFFEGVRAAEDTDFSWRLQRAGWALEGRPYAAVTHRYRSRVRELRRQWRGYAAGRAWLARRYDGFEPQPALARAGGRLLRRRSPAAPARATSSSSPPAPGRGQRVAHVALDAVLGVEELAGFALSNRPRRGVGHGRVRARVVLVAERFPDRGDPLTEYALTLTQARVEAACRPEAVERAASRRLIIDYREDDGALTRGAALIRLTVRHPLRCMADARRRGPGAPGLAALAPAVIRLQRDRGARVRALGGGDAHSAAVRLAALAGRQRD